MMPGMGGKFNARQMNQMMRRLGIQVKEIPDVQEVLIRTSDKQYTFREAEVTIMDASGSKTYQFTGEATVRDLTPEEKADLQARKGSKRGPGPMTGTGGPETAVDPSSSDEGADEAEAVRSAEEQLAEVQVEISDEDIALVAGQTGVSPKEARKVLEETKGDIAEAIVRLSG